MSGRIKKAANQAVVLIAAVSVLAALSGCAGRQTRPVPDNFIIEVKTYSTSWRPAQSLVVRADGSCKYIFIPAGIDKKPFTTDFQLTPRQVKKIRKKIKKIKFFDLKSEYIDNRWQGGWNCEISVRSGERKKTVHIANQKVPSIIKLLKTINSTTPLPNSMKFLYYVMF